MCSLVAWTSAIASGSAEKAGQHSRAEISATLCPWLKERGYADDGDDAELELFLNTQLGRRPAYLRPGLRLKRRWDIEAVQAVGGLDGLVADVRADVTRSSRLPGSRPCLSVI